MDEGARPDGPAAGDRAYDEDLELHLETLIEVCEAQRDIIDSLATALDAHRQVGFDRARDRQVFAHEVATPLTAIIGLLEILERDPTDPGETAEVVRRSLRQAENLRNMIHDFVALGDDVDVNVRRAAMSWVDVGELVADVLDSTAHRLGDHQVTIAVDDALMIRTVPSRVRQVLVNLVVNAAKHAPASSQVDIVARREPGQVVFEVLDRGPGIEPEELEAVFEAFRQGRGGAEAGGSGIGLYLVRRLAGSLGGVAALLPRPGGGTVARVTLPQKRREDVAE